MLFGVGTVVCTAECWTSLASWWLSHFRPPISHLAVSPQRQTCSWERKNYARTCKCFMYSASGYTNSEGWHCDSLYFRDWAHKVPARDEGGVKLGACREPSSPCSTCICAFSFSLCWPLAEAVQNSENAQITPSGYFVCLFLFGPLWDKVLPFF